MTEEAEVLAFVHHLISSMEELVAVNNAIAGGLVTDLHEIQDAARRSNVVLETALIGHKLMVRDGLQGKKPNTEIFDVIYKND